MKRTQKQNITKLRRCLYVIVLSSIPILLIRWYILYQQNLPCSIENIHSMKLEKFIICIDHASSYSKMHIRNALRRFPHISDELQTLDDNQTKILNEGLRILNDDDMEKTIRGMMINSKK